MVGKIKIIRINWFLVLCLGVFSWAVSLSAGDDCDSNMTPGGSPSEYDSSSSSSGYSNDESYYSDDSDDSDDEEVEVFPLHDAVAAGDIDEVLRLVSEGADVNARDGFGDTALFVALASEQVAGSFRATFRANLQMVEVLIQAGADLGMRNHIDLTPLEQAGDYGDFHACQMLLEYGGADASQVSGALCGRWIFRGARLPDTQYSSIVELVHMHEEQQPEEDADEEDVQLEPSWFAASDVPGGLTGIALYVLLYMQGYMTMASDVYTGCNL